MLRVDDHAPADLRRPVRLDPDHHMAPEATHETPHEQSGIGAAPGH